MKKATQKQRKPARKLRVVKKNAKPKPPEPQVSKDMQDLYMAMRHISIAHTLLDRGSFRHTEHQAVNDSLIFLQSLHAQVKEKAWAHPEVDLIPELKQIREKEREALEKAREASKGPVEAVGSPQDAA